MIELKWADTVATILGSMIAGDIEEELKRVEEKRGSLTTVAEAIRKSAARCNCDTCKITKMCFLKEIVGPPEITERVLKCTALYLVVVDVAVTEEAVLESEGKTFH